MLSRLALEGIDGSGKSTTANVLADMLTREGLTVATFAPYRLANAELGEDVYDMWHDADRAKHAVDAVTTVLDQCERQAEDEAVDVVIYDRHWMTAFTEIRDNPDLIKQWGDHFVMTALLKVAIPTAMKRCENDLDEIWMQQRELERYHVKFCALAAKYGKYLFGLYRSDIDVSPADLAHNIRWDMWIRR
jgi:thymidylate kinase